MRLFFLEPLRRPPGIRPPKRNPEGQNMQVPRRPRLLVLDWQLVSDSV
jgi:hypothetical protein